MTLYFEAFPHLLSHWERWRSSAVADEVVYLAGLLEFPEERLDAPPRPVELRYRPGRPLEVVREKNDLLHLAAYLDERRHPAQHSAAGRTNSSDSTCLAWRFRFPLRGRCSRLTTLKSMLAPWVECPPLDPVGLGGVLDEFARNERCYLTQVWCILSALLLRVVVFA